MAQGTIERLIVNSSSEEPARHWRYGGQTHGLALREGRRPAGHVVASPLPCSWRYLFQAV